MHVLAKVVALKVKWSMGQDRLFGVAGSNPPGSVSSLLSHRNDFVFLYTVTNPGCIHLQS